MYLDLLLLYVHCTCQLFIVIIQCFAFQYSFDICKIYMFTRRETESCSNCSWLFIYQEYGTELRSSGNRYNYSEHCTQKAVFVSQQYIDFQICNIFYGLINHNLSQRVIFLCRVKLSKGFAENYQKIKDWNKKVQIASTLMIISLNKVFIQVF